MEKTLKAEEAIIMRNTEVSELSLALVLINNAVKDDQDDIMIFNLHSPCVLQLIELGYKVSRGRYPNGQYSHIIYLK